MLGLAIIVGTFVMLAVKALPAYQALRAAQNQLAKEASGDQRAEYQPVKADRRAGLERFYARFPPIGDDLDMLERLFAAATAAGVELNKANYEVVDQGRQELLRYRIDLPVRAEYLKIRDLVQRILEDMPNVALEQLTFRRTEEDGRVQAVLSLSLYLRRQ